LPKTRQSYSILPAEQLVRACVLESTVEAWEEFIRRFHRLIAGVALRTAGRWGETAPGTIDDLVQETYLKLCADNARLLRDFKSHYPGAVFSYLRIVTANVVHDHFKSAHSSKRGGGQPGRVLSEVEAISADNIAGTQETIERDILLEEVDKFLRAHTSGSLQERDRAIFWLYYRHGMSAHAIASLPAIQLSTKGVESAILRLTRLVRTHLLGSNCVDQGAPIGERKGIRPGESL
jgi:RNA polymerase sigma-70 factor (ECF subfamily)